MSDSRKCEEIFEQPRQVCGFVQQQRTVVREALLRDVASVAERFAYETHAGEWRLQFVADRVDEIGLMAANSSFVRMTRTE